MNKLYQKSEISFAVFWIVIYVVTSSFADQISESIGITKCVTALLHIVLSLILYFWIRQNHLSEKYGLCRSKIPAEKFLYYLPLAVIASSKLWSGIGLPYGIAGGICFFISMCCVGFLEEVIFRGLLFKAMEKDGLKSAIIVSSLTFGIGHIVNLFNGSGRDLPSSLVQIIFAVMIGFTMVLIFYFSGSLISCIVFHSVNNALSAFEGAGAMDPKLSMVLNLILIIAVLGGYLLYLLKTFRFEQDAK